MLHCVRAASTASAVMLQDWKIFETVKKSKFHIKLENYITSNNRDTEMVGR